MSILQFDKTLEHLKSGEIKVEGEFIHGSNHTFLVKAYPKEDTPFLAVYKPVKGERSLWDFPENTLAHREVAAFLVSEALGWHLLPPTVFRDEAPFGPGSVQLFVEHDPNLHYFNFGDAEIQQLRPVVLFDLLINNADRKGGHIIFDEKKHMWLIDHGVCFNVEDKLRTVIWDFAGETIPVGLHEDLKKLFSKLKASSDLLKKLEDFLSREEIAALNDRAKALIARKEFPFLPKDRRAFPYPLI
ncbi:MAG: SCO1664 family protein [Chloroflexi bacterium]|nr:SCO1664 family protein [Chloroflexota bacterium]